MTAKPVTYTGKTFKFYFDGVMRFEYFQRDQNVYSDYLKDYVKDCKFSTTSGYIGFWPSSDFPVGMDSSETECYVEIDKLQITSYDNGNKTPYGIAPKPDFDIESVNFTPEASYDAGTEIEVKLADLVRVRRGRRAFLCHQMRGQGYRLHPQPATGYGRPKRAATTTWTLSPPMRTARARPRT